MVETTRYGRAGAQSRVKDPGGSKGKRSQVALASTNSPLQIMFQRFTSEQSEQSERISDLRIDPKVQTYGLDPGTEDAAADALPGESNETGNRIALDMFRHPQRYSPLGPVLVSASSAESHIYHRSLSPRALRVSRLRYGGVGVTLG